MNPHSIYSVVNLVEGIQDQESFHIKCVTDIETLPNLNLNGDIGLLMQLCSFTDH